MANSGAGKPFGAENRPGSPVPPALGHILSRAASTAADKFVGVHHWASGGIGPGGRPMASAADTPTNFRAEPLVTASCCYYAECRIAVFTYLVRGWVPMVKSEPMSTHPLADIYVVRALDPVIELSRSVAGDFVTRPEQYTRVSADQTTLLKNFRVLPGKHPDWPDAAQRSFALARLLGRFCQSFAALRLAAMQFVQAGPRSGSPMGQRAFVDAATLLRATVQPLEGAALSALAETHTAMLQRALEAVSSEHVPAAFGATAISREEWPKGMFSPQFGFLCESISKTLSVEKPLRQATVSALQRAAHHGRQTLVAVLGPTFPESDDQISEAIHSATGWAAALGDILAGINVARAWQDPAYRASLNALERDVMPPHPSGEIDVEGTIKTQAARFPSGSLGFSTETVAGEICCCTGDLSCGNETNGQCDLSDDCPTLTSVPV